MDTCTHLISEIQNQGPQSGFFLQLGDSMTRGQVSSSINKGIKGGEKEEEKYPYL